MRKFALFFCYNVEHLNNNYQMTNQTLTPSDAATKVKVVELLKNGFEFYKISVENQDNVVNNLSEALWNYFQRNRNSDGRI